MTDESKKPDLKTARTIEDFIAAFGSEVDPVQDSELLEPCRDAIRRDSALLQEKLYAEAMKTASTKLTYKSTAYMMMGLHHLVNDLVYALWEPIQNLVNSPDLKEMIEKKVGEGKSFKDFLRQMYIEKEGSLKGEEMSKDVIDLVEKQQAYLTILYEHCEKTGKTPDEALRSSTDKYHIIMRVYGSLDEYAKYQQKRMENATRFIDKAETFSKLPLELIIPIMLSSKMSADDASDVPKFLNEIGVNSKAIAKVVKLYIQDFVVITKAYYDELDKYQEKNMQQYRMTEAKIRDIDKGRDA